MRPLAPLIACMLLFAGCGVGPLPTPYQNPYGADSDRFPSRSVDPLPLDRAIYDGDIERVRRLLEGGADPNARWSEGDRFPLQDALESRLFGYPIGDPIDIVRLLLKHGADPNAKWCPFESRGSFGQGPSCSSAEGVTPLMAAAFYDFTEVVLLLLDAGADPAPRNFGGHSALDYASDPIAFEAIAQRLFPDIATRDRLSWEWLLDYRDYHVGTPASALLRAIGGSDGGYVLLKPVPPPPPPPPSPRQAPPARAIDRPWVGINGERRIVSRIEILFRLGADPNQRMATDGLDWTPLLIALRNRSVRVAHALLRHGADPNQRACVIQPTSSWPPSKIDPQCTTSNGLTPLMWMAREQNVQGISLLLDSGADMSATDWVGRTALDHAADNATRALLASYREGRR
jgi:ankyrin repeat protein